MRDALRPSRHPRPDKWCEKNIRLDKQFESVTRIDLNSRPWWRDILADITDPEVRSITIKASTQVGKTLTLIAALLYLAENDPAPAMVVLPDADSAVEFRDRLYANATATIKANGTKRISVPKPWRWNKRWCDLGSMRVYLAWSQARQRLRGRPCRRVFLSEVDVYEGNKKAGDPVAQSHQRTKAFHRYLHYHESSPTEHPSPVGTLEAKAVTRCRWHARCPHCGHSQELRFFPRHGEHTGCISGYRDPANELLASEACRSSAHYVCEKGCKIEESDRLRFIQAGEWKILGKADDQPIHDRRSLGRHLWAIHSETQSFGDLAVSYVEAHAEGKLRDWWGNMLGIEYRPRDKIPQWYEVGQRLASVHYRGTVPAGAWFLTAGMDVQADQNGCRYVVRAWGAHRTSWLVDWGWIERPNDDDAASIVRGDLKAAGDAILTQHFPTHQGVETELLGLTSLPVRLLCCDSGHSPKAVHQWMRSLPESWVVGEGTERVRAIKGDGALGGVRFQRSEVEKNVRTGEAYEGSMVIWRLAVAELYPEFCDRLFAPPGKPGSWYVTSDTLTMGKSYLEQVCNLERRIVLDRNGRKKIEWGPRSRAIPVDFADCEVYAEFAAEMIVGEWGWEPERWKKWAEARRGATAKAGSGSQARQSVRRRAEELEDLADR